MVELMPWKKQGGKEGHLPGSELDNLYDHFGGRGSMAPTKFLQNE